MNPKKIFVFAATSSLLIFQSACSCFVKTSERPEYIATYTATPIKLDGKLDDPMWQKTPAYDYYHGIDTWKDFKKALPGDYSDKDVAEPGKVRILWDKNYLYVGIELQDSDVVAEGLNDQEHHYVKGDVAEVFLKPVNQTWYWELYATPLGKRTSFFFPGRSLVGIPSFFEKTWLKDLRVASTFVGTLNESRDKDTKWTTEMAIPIAEVNMVGEKLEPNVPWLIFFGRYNYSRYLPYVENSSSPRQLRASYHIYEDYGFLKLVK